MKERIINEIIRVEGGYVNDPRDSGGETNFGITEAVARAHGYNGPMVDMPRGVAFDIYVAKYWDAVRGDQLVQLSEVVAEEVVDTSVNMGPSRAGKFLQRALNVLNRALVVELGNKVQDRHNGVTYDDPLDYFKGFTFEINPFKDIS